MKREADGTQGAEEGGREGETRSRNHHLQHLPLNPECVTGWGGELGNVCEGTVRKHVIVADGLLKSKAEAPNKMAPGLVFYKRLSPRCGPAPVSKMNPKVLSTPTHLNLKVREASLGHGVEEV